MRKHLSATAVGYLFRGTAGADTSPKPRPKFL